MTWGGSFFFVYRIQKTTCKGLFNGLMVICYVSAIGRSGPPCYITCVCYTALSGYGLGMDWQAGTRARTSRILARQNYGYVLNCTFIFQCFTAPVEGLCCNPKYREVLIHHFIFVFFLYFSIRQQKNKQQYPCDIAPLWHVRLPKREF